MKRFVFTIIASIFLLLCSVGSTFAAQSIYLQPSSGNITTGGTIVRVYYNSDGTSVGGVVFKVEYSSNLTYESIDGSSTCNSQFETNEGSNYIEVSCLSSTNQVYNGSVAAIVFSADTTGETATLTVSNEDDIPTSGGTYTTIEGSADEDLPDTAISEPITILIGLMLIGFGFVMYKYQIARLNIEDSIVEYTGSLKDKVQGKR